MLRSSIALLTALGISATCHAQFSEEEAFAGEPRSVPEESPASDGEGPEGQPAAAEPAREAPPHLESPTARPPSALRAQIVQRNEIAVIHRGFGIATWGSMLVTAVLGFLQYYNLYGFFSGREATPCVAGGAIFGQEACWGTPWPHLIGAITTTALYTTTFVLSFTMPDPLGAGNSNADLRLHKDLRWVHLGGMIAQMLFGFAIANDWLGLDRANDYEAQQVLASVHQLIGWTTLGVLTAAGLIMMF